MGRVIGPLLQEAAEKLGVSLRSWQGMERGENVPNGETLLKFQALGFNAGWVLTGLGFMLLDRSYLDAKHIIPTAINEEVMDNLVVMTISAHDAMKIRLHAKDIVRETTKLYNELVSIVDDALDQDELLAAVPVLEVRLRKRLADAKAAPGTGKHQAS